MNIRPDRDQFYKIITIALCTAVLFLFALVLILFNKIGKNEKLLGSLEVSLANDSLTIDDANKAGMDADLYGRNLSVDDAEAELLIDNNENRSIAIEKEQPTDDKRVVYLTFDDGPSSNTARILEILKEYDVKATFFINGKQSEELRLLITQMYAEGHSVGMHSYSHKYSEVYSSPENFSEDFKLIEHLIFAQTGEHPKLYRFPGGSSNSVSKGRIGEFIDVLKKNNVEYVDWNISSKDATGTTALNSSVIADNVVNDFLNTDYQTNVVLMHDTDLRDTTVEALPDIIKRLRSEGAVLSNITDDTPKVHHVEK